MQNVFDSGNEAWTEIATATAASGGLLANMTQLGIYTAAEKKMMSGIFTFAGSNSFIKKKDCLYLCEKFKVLMLQRTPTTAD